MIKKNFILITLLLITNISYSETKIGNIKITDAYILNSSPNANMLGGYFKIENLNNTKINLMSVECNLIKQVQIHKTEIENNQMRMIKINDGVTIGANESLEFKHGSYHLMLMGFKNDINNFKKIELLLNFENLKAIKVVFDIKNLNINQ